jgi:hypothetical protein
MAEKRALLGRCPMRNHRIAGAGKQPSMRSVSAQRSAIPIAKTARLKTVTR